MTQAVKRNKNQGITANVWNNEYVIKETYWAFDAIWSHCNNTFPIRIIQYWCHDIFQPTIRINTIKWLAKRFDLSWGAIVCCSVCKNREFE